MKNRTIAIKDLKALYEINPDINAEGLIKLANYYALNCEELEKKANPILNVGESVTITTFPDIPMYREAKTDSKFRNILRWLYEAKSN